MANFSSFKKERAQSRENSNDYFTLAKSWADDIYTEAIASRNRYKIAFYWVALISSLLIILLMMLMPLQHTELVIVHHYDNGATWIEPTHQKYAPINRAQTASDIVRYIINREGYAATFYAEQYKLVNLISSADVANEYAKEQDAGNSSSPVTTLGTHGYRTVHVDNVVFLDDKDLEKNPNAKLKHANIAQVYFTVKDCNRISGCNKPISYTALLSWEYRGIPQNPEDMWRNWDGFSVTEYSREQRNLNQ